MIRTLLPALASALACLSMSDAFADTTPAPAVDPLHAWAQARIDAGDAGAIVVARIENGQVRIDGFGRRHPDSDDAPDARTRFQLGSLTKVFTHLLLAERVAQDNVRYEQTLASLLPDDLQPANPALTRITLQQLATHRSGLPRLPPNLVPVNHSDPYAGFDADALLAGYTASRAGQPLGDQYGYSNFGTGLLGYALARQAGEDYYPLLQRHVIEPMSLRDTGALPGDNAAQAMSDGKPVAPWRNDDILIAASGGLWGSAGDLVRLLQIHLGQQQHGFTHALEDDLSVIASDDDGMAVTRVWHVAHAGDQPIYWHNGSTMNFWSFAGFRPDTSQAVAVLASGDADPTAVAFAALGQTARQPATQTIDPSLLGQYRLTEHFGIGIRTHQGRVYAQGSGQPPLAMHAMEDGWYALHEVDASIRLLPADDDHPARLEFVQGGMHQHGERVADTADADRHVRVELPIAVLDDYVGRYQLAPGIDFTIRRSGDALEAMLTGQGFLTLLPAGDDRFFYVDVDASLQFSRDEQGTVTALTLHQGATVQRAERVSDEDA